MRTKTSQRRVQQVFLFFPIATNKREVKQRQRSSAIVGSIELARRGFNKDIVVGALFLSLAKRQYDSNRRFTLSLRESQTKAATTTTEDANDWILGPCMIISIVERTEVIESNHPIAHETDDDKMASSIGRDRRRQDAQLAAEAQVSLDSVTAQLDSWTSDRVGTGTPHFPQSSPRFHYASGGDEEVTWLNNVLESGEDDVEMDEYPSVSTPFASRTPRSATALSLKTPVSGRRGALDRADTPVMSNSKRVDEMGENFEETPAREVPSPNVHTPAPRSTGRSSLARRLTTPRRGVTPTKLPLESRQQVELCQRYHDMFLQFFQAKRRWVDRNSAVSLGAMVPHDNSASRASMISDDARIQLEFLQGITTVCYEDHVVDTQHSKDETPCREGNFWNMLYHLRTLGVDALLWDQYNNTLQVPSNLDEDLTSLEVIEALKDSKKLAADQQPVSLTERRYQLLEWMENCFERQLPLQLQSKENARSLGSGRLEMKSNSELYKTQGLPESEKDASLLRQSLALVLAGRISQAQELMRANGLTWRAAVWGGGKPANFNEKASLGNDRTRVGNPNRALWQSTLWRLVEESNRPMTHDEKAIASLLCNNVKASLSNPALRTWEKALYAGLKAMVGRTEDVALYCRGAAVANKFARTHLDNTADFAVMDESRWLSEIQSTPYTGMLSSDEFATVTAAFMIGQRSIGAYFYDLPNTMQDDDSVFLRFITHLVLYLDSLTVGPFAASYQWDMNQIRDSVVVKYIRSLASRELWNMIVLYAAMLPRETMLQHLPSLLAPVVNLDDRQIIVTQLHELLPEADLDVLKAIVDCEETHPSQNLLTASIEENEENVDRDDSMTDERLMKALSWFCFLDDHAHAAVSFANSLVRRFLLQDKLDAVFHFVENVRPTNLVEKAERIMETDGEEMPDRSAVLAQESALSEYSAYEAYLDAEKAFSHWIECIVSAKASLGSGSSRTLMTEKNTKEWNEIEREIAASRERAMVVEETQALGRGVAEVALEAQKALMEVLRHGDGGWLWEEFKLDDAFADPIDVVSNLNKRQEEMLRLRKKTLVRVTILLGQVIEETAAFMSNCLHYVVTRIPPSRSGTSPTMASALTMLDSTLTAEQSAGVHSSLLSPAYWTGESIELADTLASDRYNVPVDEQVAEMMAKMAVLHLQWCSDLE